MRVESQYDVASGSLTTHNALCRVNFCVHRVCSPLFKLSSFSNPILNLALPLSLSLKL